MFRFKKSSKSANLAFEGVAPIIPDKRLRACNYGKFNAQPSEIVEPMQEKHITEHFPGGESYEDVKARIADFLNFLKKNYDGKNIAIFAHKAPQLALDVLIKGKTWEEAFAEDWRKKKISGPKRTRKLQFILLKIRMKHDRTSLALSNKEMLFL